MNSPRFPLQLTNSIFFYIYYLEVYMCNYVVFVTSELVPVENDFIDDSLTKFFPDFKSAFRYGSDVVAAISESTPFVDFYIYSLVYSDEGTDPFVP